MTDKLRETLYNLAGRMNRTEVISEDDIKYRIYWSTKQPHCDLHIPVVQVDGITAYVCRHEVGNE